MVVCERVLEKKNSSASTRIKIANCLVVNGRLNEIFEWLILGNYSLSERPKYKTKKIKFTKIHVTNISMKINETKTQNFDNKK